jgi:hypothetical protein
MFIATISSWERYPGQVFSRLVRPSDEFMSISPLVYSHPNAIRVLTMWLHGVSNTWIFMQKDAINPGLLF